LAGLSAKIRGIFPETWTAWLTWEDSNLHITISKNAFEMSTEFPLFWPKFRLGDFCSHKLQFLLEKLTKSLVETLSAH
jgi:hypothetical protein